MRASSSASVAQRRPRVVKRRRRALSPSRHFATSRAFDASLSRENRASTRPGDRLFRFRRVFARVPARARRRALECVGSSDSRARLVQSAAAARGRAGRSRACVRGLQVTLGRTREDVQRFTRCRLDANRRRRRRRRRRRTRGRGRGANRSVPRRDSRSRRKRRRRNSS